jgi:hypothetical protein
MADTARLYREDLECDECHKSPVQFVHWGDLTGGVKKQLCGDCWLALIAKSEAQEIAITVKT